jgi:SAM-dependent methyltransferase
MIGRIALLRRSRERVAEQARAPSGLFGRFCFWVMSHETKRDNQLAVELMEVQPDDRVLEIGFGHGRTLAMLAALASDGFVAGIDPSPLMVQLANRRYRALVASGVLRVSEATSANIPHQDSSFDRACAVHTCYFWPNPRRDFGEIRRVLRDGGVLVVGVRAKEDAARTAKYPANVYHFYDEDELRSLACDSGFSHVEFHERRLRDRELIFMRATA